MPLAFVGTTAGFASPSPPPSPQYHALSVITSVIAKDAHYLNGFFADVAATKLSQPWELVLATIEAHMHALLHEHVSNVTAEASVSSLPTFTFVEYEADPGLYEVWDDLIVKATADVVTNWNVDDRKHPEALAKKLDVLLKRPDVAVVTSGCLAFDELSPHAYRSYAESHMFATARWHTAPEDRALCLADLVKVNATTGLPQKPHNVPHNSPMWRKSIHAAVGKFAQDAACDDWALWTRVLRAGLKVWHLRDVLEIYLVSATSHNRRDPASSEVCVKRVLDDLTTYGLLPWGTESWPPSRRNVLLVHELLPTLDQGGNMRLRQILEWLGYNGHTVHLVVCERDLHPKPPEDRPRSPSLALARPRSPSLTAADPQEC